MAVLGQPGFHESDRAWEVGKAEAAVRSGKRRPLPIDARGVIGALPGWLGTSVAGNMLGFDRQRAANFRQPDLLREPVPRIELGSS